MKRTFLLYVLAVVCCLCLPVAAQERQYTITETELIELERISESLAISKQNQQFQANSLTERLKAQERQAKTLAVSLQEVEQKAKALNSQLQTERASLKDLRTSYNKSEQEAAETIAEKQALIDEQKDKLHRRMVTIIILSSIISMIIIAIVVKWFIKGKLSFLRPP